MNSSVKKMTEAAVLSAVFIIITMLVLSMGLGYSVYLDFCVPIIFALIYFRCDFKYTFLCGISCVLLILFVLGNFVAAILVSQSFLLGMLCGFLINKSSGIFDDFYIGGMITVLFMVFIDIYARNIIGYSFMQEFQEYIDYIKSGPEFLMKFVPSIKDIDFQLVYNLLVSIFPLGMLFSIYILSTLAGKRLNILKKDGKRKYFMIRSIKTYGSFMCLNKIYFYGAIVYVVIMNLFRLTNFNLDFVYIKTILISAEYLSYYFIFRDTHVIIGNYINARLRNKSINLLYFFVTFVLLCNFFKLTLLCYVVFSIYLDKRYNTRYKQKEIVDMHTNKLMEMYK